MAISAEQRKAVKGQGFLSNKNQNLFSARIITVNGVLTGQQIKCLGDAAEQFGNGQVTFTSRMTLELPGVAFEDIAAFQTFIAQADLKTGGTGAKVRPVVACKGTVCVFGNLDTQELAMEIHRRFFEGYSSVALPHKFKIAVGGCPNNCVKPDLNDVGIIGQRVPELDKDLCRGCARCAPEAACPMKACTVEDGLLTIDRARCNNCGICTGKCPFNAVKTSRVGCKFTIGGRWGKDIRIGTPLDGIYTEEETLDLIEKTILLFKEKGLPGERLSTMVERLGRQETEQALMGPALLERKQKLLGNSATAGDAHVSC